MRPLKGNERAGTHAIKVVLQTNSPACRSRGNRHASGKSPTSGEFHAEGLTGLRSYASGRPGKGMARWQSCCTRVQGPGATAPLFSEAGSG
jgi:hypothetical protein